MSALHQIRQSSTERRCTCQHAQGFEGVFITQSFSGQLVVRTPTYCRFYSHILHGKCETLSERIVLPEIYGLLCHSPVTVLIIDATLRLVILLNKQHSLAEIWRQKVAFSLLF